MGLCLMVTAREVCCLNSSEKSVLFVLASRANDNSGACWPSIRTIMQEAGVKTERTVQRALRKLVEIGFLGRRRRVNKSSMYHVFPEGVPDKNAPPDEVETTKTHPLPLTKTHYKKKGVKDNQEEKTFAYAYASATVGKSFSLKEEAEKIVKKPVKKNPYIVGSSKMILNKQAEMKEQVQQTSYFEILSRAKKKMIHKDKNRIGVKVAEIFWKDMMQKYHADVGYVPEFTIKVKGQMNMLGAILIKAYGTPQDAIGVIGQTMRHWGKFINYCTNAAGLKHAPDNPHVGFMLQYVQEVIGNYEKIKNLDDVNPLKVQSIALGSVKNKQDVIHLDKPSVEIEKEKPITLEEIEALEQDSPEG